MDPINTIDIVEWPNGKFDFRIIASENGNILCSSHQGYEDQDVCEAMAYRVSHAPVGKTTFSKG